jgi:hypothetical protein
VKKSEPAIKKDLGALQKRIVTIDQEAKKQLHIVNLMKNEYEGVAEVRDHIIEKRNIMHTTYATLKRDIHTRK